ncbi:MAG: phosphonopyruvate decarboxylase [Agathobacter sp.]
MNVQDLFEQFDIDFYTGVPDSQLKALCNYLADTFGISRQHIIAANEGNCTALAAGYHLATGKIPLVYMQNSGIGNIVNPVASLLNEKVYGIPCIFVIGWRGEPRVHDEPQHIFQGEISEQLLKDIGLYTIVIAADTTVEDLQQEIVNAKNVLKDGKGVAFLVRKNGLRYDAKVEYSNPYSIVREEAIEEIVKVSGEDIIVSTTGKTSRELFEIRERNHQSHKYDFLTVGSMGHSSSIALGIALYKPNARIWCVDGDGAALMHMGSMAVIGSNSPKNLVHIVLNNEAHETVGGMPTVAGSIDLLKIAEGCGYTNVICVDSLEALHVALCEARERQELSFIEVKCAIGSREDLGRPTTTARENKQMFMEYLKTL